MIEELLALLGYGLCHQLPERTFIGAGVALPVCARDAGIYIGFTLALVAIRLADGRRRSSEPPTAFGIAVLGTLILVMVVDGVSSYAGWRTTTNELRLLTGLMAGFGIAGFTVPMLNGQLWQRPGTTRLLGDPLRLSIFLLGIPVAYALTYWGGPLLGLAYPLLTGVAILLTFTVVNAVIVALMPPFERRAQRLIDGWPVWFIGFMLAVAEIAMSAWLKSWAERLAGLV